MPEYEGSVSLERAGVDAVKHRVHGLFKEYDWYKPEYGHAIGIAVVECCSFLGVDSPDVELMPKDRQKQAPGSDSMTTMEIDYDTNRIADGTLQYANFSLRVSPVYLEMVASPDESNSRFSLDHMQFCVAHEIYHVYNLLKFPKSVDTHKPSEDFDSSREYNGQRLEYAANLFALSYMKSKLFAEWSEVLPRFLFLLNRRQKIQRSRSE